MSNNVYYVNTSVTPYLNSTNQISEVSFKIKKQTKINSSFDNVINNHAFITNGNSSRKKNLIGYYFRHEESQKSIIQSCTNINNNEKNKSYVNKSNNVKNFLPNAKKVKTQNINLNKSKDYPTNYGFYESKYSKKKNKILQNECPQPRKILSNISDNNTSNLKQKVNNSKSYKIPCTHKITTELNFFPQKNNVTSQKNLNDQTSKKNPNQFFSQKNLEKKKINKSYISSNNGCFSPIRQLQVKIDSFMDDNQTYNIIQKNNTRKKNKIVNTIPYQTTEKKINNKGEFKIEHSIKNSKSNDKIKIKTNYNQNYKNNNYSNCDLEKNYIHNYNYTQNIENRNKSPVNTVKQVFNLNLKEIPFNNISKISSTPRSNNNNKFYISKSKDKILTNDLENIIYNNNTEPHNKKRSNRFEKYPTENDNNSFIHIVSNGENNTIQISIKNTKPNENKKNNKKMMKKYKSTKLKPLDIVNIKENKKILKNNKNISEKNITINNIENNNENKSSNIIKTFSNNESKTIEQRLTHSKNNHQFFEEPKKIFINNVNKHQRLTLSDFKNKLTKNKSLNIKRSPADFAKFERLPRKTNQKEDEWDQVQYVGLRKRTYDLKKRTTKYNNSYSVNAEFSSTNYIKECKAVSIPGKNEHGFKKTNQDTYLIERNINGILNFNIFGVLDGHGIDGHFASQFLSRYIIYRIKNHPKIKILDEPTQIYYKLKENGYKIIANIFTDADLQIQKEKFEYHKSGTTCVIVIQLEEHLICANVGDSRAILVYDENYDDNLLNSKIYCLSYDCKPNLPLEKKRIYEYGGTVEKALDENDKETGPYRVWAKNEDYPGLAMSRSIGDIDAKKFGVIPNPQIVEYTLSYYSKYMIICSDGVWEFIDNERAMKIGNKYYLRNDPQGLCQELIQQAINFWINEDIVIDDITVVTVFF